jgi:hypothetical protein
VPHFVFSIRDIIITTTTLGFKVIIIINSPTLPNQVGAAQGSRTSSLHDARKEP